MTSNPASVGPAPDGVVVMSPLTALTQTLRLMAGTGSWNEPTMRRVVEIADMCERDAVPAERTREAVRDHLDRAWLSGRSGTPFDPYEAADAILSSGITAWNTRAPHPDPGGEVERLRDADALPRAFLDRLDALHGELAMFGANMRRDAADERSDDLIPYAESVKHLAGVLSEIIMDMVPDQQAAVSTAEQPGIFALRENEPKARHQPTTPGEQGEEG